MLTDERASQRLDGIKPTAPGKHQPLLWNRNLEQWCCPKCGRTSDHTTLEDARQELEQFDVSKAR